MNGIAGATLSKILTELRRPGVAVGSGVGVAVGSGVGVAVGSEVGVAVGSGVSVAVGSGIGVAVGSRLAATVGSSVTVDCGSSTHADIRAVTIKHRMPTHTTWWASFRWKLVEKVFGTLKRGYGYSRVRYCGLGRIVSPLTPLHAGERSISG